MASDGVRSIGIVRKDDLQDIACFAVEEVKRERLAENPKDMHAETHTLACIVLLERIMGRGWVARELVADHKSYLGIGGSGNGDTKAMAFQQRLIRAAHVIYGLHDLEHVGERLLRLKGTEVESRMAELAIVALLRHAGTPVWFRPELDGGYEADAMLDDQTLAALEVKCRIEGTRLQKGSLVGRLKEARDQLPDDRVTMVWVRIPFEWTRDPACESVVVEATREFLRNTARVSMVAYHWEERRQAGEGFGILGRFRGFANPRARHAPTSLTRLVERLRNTYFYRIVLDEEVGRACADLVGKPF